MNSSRPTGNTTQKRLACDRCHARKLRCLRKTSTARCSRCMHDGVACTFSPPLKSGRPKKTSMAAETSKASSSEGSPPPPGTGSDGIPATIATPLPELADIDSAHDWMNITSGADFLCHVDLMGGLSSSNLSSAHPMSLDTSSWLDMLGDGEHPAVMTEPYPEKLLLDDDRKINGGYNLNSPGLFGRPDPRIPIEPSAREGRSQIVEKLGRLQQELTQLRASLCGEGGTAPKVLPQQSALNSVDAALRPGQELVDTVRQLFDQCALDRSTHAHQQQSFWDRQTLLPLVFTPLSLLLSTYGDVLRDITTALPQTSHRIDKVNHDCHATNHVSTASSAGSENQTKYGDGAFALPPSPSSVFTNSNTNSDKPSPLLIPGNLNLSLGDMSLDQPLQLIIVTTVIKHHLVHLENALHIYGTYHMQGCSAPSPSEGFFLSALAELKSYARLLISETAKVV